GVPSDPELQAKGLHVALLATAVRYAGRAGCASPARRTNVKSISRRGLLKMGAALAAAPAAVRNADAAQRAGTRQDGGTLEAAAPVNPGRHILLRGGTIITMDPAVGDFAIGDVHIQGKHIVE